MLHGHGDDRYKYNVPIKADFSSNIVPECYRSTLPLSKIDWLQAVYRYPDPNAESLQQKIAEHHRCDVSQVMVTNGATEAFYLIAKAFEGQSATIIQPTFAEYHDACEQNNMRCKTILWSEFDAPFICDTALLFICNPNNPTGQLLDLDVLEAVLVNNPESVLVLDEAYIEFAHQGVSAIQLGKKYKNLLIVKSLTKNFAIPGLRLGYVYGEAGLVKKILQYKMPWSVNAVAIKVGEHIMAHYNELLFEREELLKATKQLWERVNDITDLFPLPTATNYFLIQLGAGTAAKLKHFLIEKHGILVRDASNFKGIGGEFIRVACQSPQENKLLITALSQWRHISI